MAIQLHDEVQRFTGVGPQMAAKLARIHIHTAQDVLFHLPHRYEDKTRVTEVRQLEAGHNAVVIAQIHSAHVIFGRRRSLVVHLNDEGSALTLRLFHFSRSQEKGFKQGAWVRCYGTARLGSKGFEMVHPEYRVFNRKPSGGVEQTLTPVYPTTEGISQLFWRKITDQALSQSLTTAPNLLNADVLPAELKESLSAISLQDALVSLHRPSNTDNIQSLLAGESLAHKRLIYEELLAHHFSLKKARALRSSEVAPAFKIDAPQQQSFLAKLPFQLTAAQSRVLTEVFKDLSQPQPMMRLIQGDVGSGKTVVAAAALIQAAINRQQAVLMAPTELLAEQHYRTLQSWLEPLGIEVGWLAAKTPAKQKQATIEALSRGDLLVVVGTHALFQEGVIYKQLGLLVIDEQHRFGVDQRLALRNKTPSGTVPHQLAMTATPIPRTLAMSFYADLDVSSIDELPPGRTPIETVVMSAAQKRDAVIKRVKAACEQGKQVYWVCPLIDESELLSAQAATEVEQELKEKLGNIPIGLVHGRLKAKEKEAVMNEFREDATKVLVATTVIEVGVDVPNASLMIIENAERMGLAQLHQLRGRVGRGTEKSFCILLYQEPLGLHAKQRLEILRQSNDGFLIAEKDLEMRGAGELLGTRQTGSLSFKIADIMRDQSLLPLIPKSAEKIQNQSPSIIEPLIERWIGERENYASA